MAEPAPAPAPAPAPDKPWHDGVDQETLGHWQNKGYDLKDPKAVAVAATKAHREAERLIGAPAAQMVRLPTETSDAEGWKAVWSRLGAPADAKEYGLPALKDKDGKVANEALDTHLRSLFGKHSVPKAMADAIASGLVEFDVAHAKRQADEAAVALEAERGALKQNWGTNYDAHMLVAKNAAAKLGVAPEAVSALERMDKVGYAKVMEMFRNLGTMMGEAKFITNPQDSTATMTVEQAIARKADLMKDEAWRDRYMKGGTVENKELQGLLAIITGAGK